MQSGEQHQQADRGGEPADCNLCTFFHRVPPKRDGITGLIPFSSYVFPAFAGIVLIAVSEENGVRTALMVYLSVSLLSLFLIPDQEAKLLAECTTAKASKQGTDWCGSATCI